MESRVSWKRLCSRKKHGKNEESVLLELKELVGNEAGAGP